MKKTTVRYVERNNTVVLDNGTRRGYEVDLDRIQNVSPWNFADWVCHLEDKSWVTDEMLGEFVRVVKEATRERHQKDIRDFWQRAM